MKKYEYINKIRNYVYKKDNFTLQDLMQEFEISKSTALRYIAALEEIGVPIYSEMGRYGGYRILETYKIPPITFTPQETYALFFSIKGMELIECTPFQAEFRTIKEKFLDAISPKIKSTLEQIQNRISFGTIKITKECPLLENILQSIMKPSILRIVYQSSDNRSVRKIQPIGIFAEFGSWYCPAFDIDKNEYRLFRCDRIKEVATLDDPPLDNLMQFNLDNRFQLVSKNSNAVDYKIGISKEGKAIFEQCHYPNMSLEETNAQLFISGWINPSEMDFLMTYLHQFGQYLLSIYPEFIKQNFVKQLAIIRNRLDSE
jgi:predicted DNA-binding transcriptional regulator YafY